MIHREFWLQVVVEVVLPVSIPLLVWLALLQGQATVGGFTAVTLRQYYILIAIIAVLGHTVVHGELSRLVHEGTLSQWLIRPVPFWSYLFSLTLARVLALAVPVALVTLLLALADPAIFSGMGIQNAAAAMMVLPMAVILVNAVNVLIGLLAFWFIEIEGVYAGIVLGLGFFSGLIVPTTLFPPLLRTIGLFLPYHAVFGSPVESVLHPSLAGLALTLLAQASWLVLICAAIYFLWPYGLRRFDAVGG